MAVGPGSVRFGASQIPTEMTAPSSSRRTGTLMEGLPKQFVSSMRTLFDIMDDRKLGYVHLADIESRWPEERLPPSSSSSLVRNDMDSHNIGYTDSGPAATKAAKPEPQPQQPPPQLPRGVIESLRKVTPPNGLLSFERFCAGLKICLLRNRTTEAGNLPSTNAYEVGSGGAILRPSIGDGHSHEPRQLHRRSVPSQSVPPIVARSHSTEAIQPTRHQMLQSKVPIRPEVPPLSTNSNNMNSNTATVRPNIVLPSAKKVTAPPLRTVSMPQLLASSSNQLSVPPSSSRQHPAAATKPFLEGDSQPHLSEQPRMPTTGRRIEPMPTAYRSRSRRGIMTMLHNWHVGMLNDQQLQVGGGGGADDGEDGADVIEHEGGDAREYVGTVPGDEAWMANRRTGPTMSRRREPRRHTLANGIDYNMLKRMKQMEQEKDVLMQGLEAVDKARAWYLRQIVQVQDKMKYIGHGSSHQEYSTEAHQERLNFEMAQIFEVNQNLSALVESSERGFPLHMNLAVRQRRPPPPATTRSQSMDAAATSDYEQQQQRSLAELNRQLNMKSERITQLEMEKAALVRELFQARSQVKSAVGASSGGREVHDVSLM